MENIYMKRKLISKMAFKKKFGSYPKGHVSYNRMTWFISSNMIKLFGTEIEVEKIENKPYYKCREINNFY